MADPEELFSFFLDLAESLCLFVKDGYDETDEDITYYVLEAFEKVLRYGMMIINEDEARYALIDMLRSIATLIISVGSFSMSHGGRPRLMIGEEQLTYLVEQGFHVQDIADLFDCSRKTIERRMNEYGISLLNSTTITDDHLNSCVKEIATLFSRCGENTISGRLKSCNIRVPH